MSAACTAVLAAIRAGNRPPLQDAGLCYAAANEFTARLSALANCAGGAVMAAYQGMMNDLAALAAVGAPA